MVEFAPNDEPEASRRRSTRLVQSVPLTVEGVDALGQTFKERTSTLIINCHGCKFLSKHYVLKASWLTLEIPHPQSGQPPRRVRAQVEWVQRPRTVRELFQIGVELEVPGNVWGIAFPPADWVALPGEAPPEAPAAEAPKPVAVPPKPPEEKQQVAPRPAAPTAAAPPPAPPPVAAKPPAPAPAPPAPVSRAPSTVAPPAVPQLDALLAEARQQIQKLVRESVHTAAAAETNQLLSEVSQQIQAAANKAVETATRSTTEDLLKRAAQDLEASRKSQADQMQQAWSAQLERGLSEATAQLITRFQEASTPLHDNFRERLASDLAGASARTEDVARQAKDLEGALRAHLTEAQSRLSELRTEMESAAAASRAATQAQVRELEESTRQLTKATQDALGHAIAEAQGRLAELRKEMDVVSTAALERRSSKVRSIEETTAQLQREAAASLNTAVQDARAQLTELRREMDAAAEALRSITEARRKELNDASQQITERTSASLAGQLAMWREQLESDMTMAGTEWNSMLEQAIHSSTARVNEQMEQAAGGTIARTEQDLQARAAAIRRSLEEATAGINQSFQGLLASLRQDLDRASVVLQEVHSATSRVEEYAARVQAVGRETAEQLERRSAEILDARSAELAQRAEAAGAELARRAESSFADLSARTEAAKAEFAGRAESASADLAQRAQSASAEIASRAEAAAAELARRAESASAETLDRLRPQLETTAQQFLAQLVSNAEQQLAPHLARASEAADRLSGTAQQAERDLETHRVRIREATEEQIRSSLAHLQATSDELRKAFAETGHADLERLLKDLDEKSTEATHTTFEALYKSAEWYQKKAQTAMQTALDRILNEAGNRLREQAAEISRVFAGELDHRSRSYVDHTQGLLEDAAKDAGEKARGQFDRLRETRLASFDDEARQLASGMLDSMREAADRSLTEKSERITEEFKRRVAEHADKTSTHAQQEVESALLSIMDAWRVERDTQLQTLQALLLQSSDRSVDTFKERLENASNAWLAASMATLQARAQAALTMFGTSTDEKVREAVAKSLAGLADAMHERLLSLSVQLAPPLPRPPEEK